MFHFNTSLLVAHRAADSGCRSLWKNFFEPPSKDKLLRGKLGKQIWPLAASAINTKNHIAIASDSTGKDKNITQHNGTLSPLLDCQGPVIYTAFLPSPPCRHWPPNNLSTLYNFSPITRASKLRLARSSTTTFAIVRFAFVRLLTFVF
jgi:hypothetical protein